MRLAGPDPGRRMSAIRPVRHTSRPPPTSAAVLVLGSVLVLGALGTGVAESPFSHHDWTSVLERFVDRRGQVDYRGLARDRSVLERYVKALERASPKSHPELFPTRDHALAYYLNAYNAMVFVGVLERGPEEISVWKGGLISGYRFFVGRKFVLGGEKTHLKELEDDVIRRGFEDPRVHAALNCASISCPRLPRKAFDPEGLEEELQSAMREFVADPRHVDVVASQETVHLSKIFDWFSRDFLGDERRRGNPDPNLIDYLNRYRGEATQVPRHYRIRFRKYDKGINKQ